jgi:ubiquinone/menaquinone biosynthesis C-methylase UbiE
MLKMYHKEEHSGSTPDYWEGNWENAQFESAVRFCLIDPLRRLFEKYSKPGSLMLEGGCGMGQYLAFYAAEGRRVVGLDFAQNTLKRLHQRDSSLPLACGDVSRLPFADETFDLYYSGGVVEHFEGGAEASLTEARRVIKKDGILLISVPYFSPLRRALVPFKRKDWRKLTRPEVDKEKFAGDKTFFQYAYRKEEFEKMLRAAGLQIKETVGYSVLWGLYDIPFMTPPDNDGVSSSGESGAAAALDIKALIENEKPGSLLKRLVMSEDTGVPVAGWLVRFMQWSSANLVMYVCTRG